MKKLSLALFVSLLALSGTSFAQSKAKTPEPTSEITESTDPARADEVMRRAEEIQSRQQSSGDMSSGDSGTKAKKSGKHMKSKKSSKGASGGGDASSGASTGSDASSGSSAGGDNGAGK
ncbi:MAG TPA: hypothetical protein VEC35_23550 [Noviherbaspirillum sp.]|nr:hypothetical protein [Noviherbaspirillum sp.]